MAPTQRDMTRELLPSAARSAGVPYRRAGIAAGSPKALLGRAQGVQAGGGSASRYSVYTIGPSKGIAMATSA